MTTLQRPWRSTVIFFEGIDQNLNIFLGSAMGMTGCFPIYLGSTILTAAEYPPGKQLPDPDCQWVTTLNTLMCTFETVDWHDLVNFPTRPIEISSPAQDGFLWTHPTTFRMPNFWRLLTRKLQLVPSLLALHRSCILVKRLWQRKPQ